MNIVLSKNNIIILILYSADDQSVGPVKGMQHFFYRLNVDTWLLTTYVSDIRSTLVTYYLDLSIIDKTVKPLNFIYQLKTGSPIPCIYA